MKKVERPRLVGVAGKYVRFATTAIWRRGLLRAIGDFMSELAFDQRHGLRAFLPTEVPGADPDAVQYQGVSPRIGRRILAQLPVVAFRANFVDFGCGKGRGLALGLLAGFRRLHGVELLPSLAGVARGNLQRLCLRHPECVLTLSAGNAAEFPLPPGAVVAFLYNPFRGPTLRRVAERLRRHAAIHPVWVVYVNPEELAVFEGLGFSVVGEVRPGSYLDAVILVPPPVV